MSSQEKKPSLRDYLFIYYSDIYTSSTNIHDELEIKFGTNFKNKITKIQFDNTIKKLYSLGFKMINASGDYHLNISPEFIDFKTQKSKKSSMRVEIKGLSNISQYCKSNTFDTEEIPSYVHIIDKKVKKKNDMRLNPIDNKNFEFRINYKEEQNLLNDAKIENYKANNMKNMLRNWKYSKKTYRYIKRYTMVHDDLPMKVDLSIVKSSSTKYNHRVNRRYLVPTLKIEESNVFNNPENYEIEIELDNDIINEKRNLQKNKTATNKDNEVIIELEKNVKKCIKYVLSGIQNSNYPISYTEQKDVIEQYFKQVNFMNSESDGNDLRITTRDFIGPQPVSLEMKNVVSLNDDINAPNINASYSVTEKADGIRKLLYINKKGKIYLINQQMNVEFTGSVTENKEIFNTILDGEHVLYNKQHSYINTFLCFDIYIYAGIDCRMLPLFKKPEDTENKKKKSKDYRMRILEASVKKLKVKSIVQSGQFKVSVKRFLTNATQSIFKASQEIINQINEGLFDYETDGLIFTPMYKSVGSDKLGESYDYKNKKYVKWDYKLENKKKTWEYSFKWKPPEFNTVDFLVRTKKGENQKDEIKNIYDNGSNLSSLTNIKQYKTLILNVGFNEKFHGYMNPFEDIVQNNTDRKMDNTNYRPMPFYPSAYPTDYPTYLTNILLKTEGNDKYLTTENGDEMFMDDTIVEFKFDASKPKQWQWIPIRVRNDKTTEYKNGKKNYGNSYNVADSVWRSINNPVTEDIICGKENPGTIDENLYYNRTTNKSNTMALRDFHNKYVKKKLIDAVSNPGDTLIDMTVGKAGDLYKWIQSKLSFVFGMDLYKDNIFNRLDGACARWLNQKSQIKNIPDALFITGDAGKDFLSGECCTSEKNKEIINAVFGKGPRDEDFLGTGVYNQYGKEDKGFDIV